MSVVEERLRAADLSNDRTVFEYVEEHLLRQGSRSTSHGLCLYRGPDDVACAVGCLLTDEEARVGDSGTTTGEAFDLSELIDKLPSVAERIGHVDRGMLLDLQNVHDARVVAEWRTWLDDTRKTHRYLWEGTT